MARIAVKYIPASDYAADGEAAPLPARAAPSTIYSNALPISEYTRMSPEKLLRTLDSGVSHVCTLGVVGEMLQGDLTLSIYLNVR